MKKLLFIFIFILLFAMNLQSQEISEDEVLINKDLLENVEGEKDQKTDPAAKGKSKRMRNRGFEIGLLNLDIGVGNNFIGLTEIFQEKLVLDFTNFKDDFNLAFDVNVRPIFFNIYFKDKPSKEKPGKNKLDKDNYDEDNLNEGNHDIDNLEKDNIEKAPLDLKNKWGIGMDIARVSVYGNVDISGNILQINKTDDDKFGAGAAAFVDVGIPAFFHVGKLMGEDFKVTARLAGYVPLVYAEPNMKYTFKNIKDGSLIEIAYGMKVLSAVSFNPEDDMMSTLDIGNSLGMDISLGLEYPLTHILKVVDMDVGIDFINIPLFPSGLSNYMEMKGKVRLDSSKIDIQELIDTGKLSDDAFYIPETFDPEFSSGDRVNIFRPFKMLFSAKYRPLKMNPQLLTISAAMGFAINPIFVNPASFEMNLKAICDLNNLFIPSIGIAYEDQMWKQGIDLVLNLRAVEWNLGVAMLSQDFLKSWTAAGVRINLGGKVGW